MIGVPRAKSSKRGCHRTWLNNQRGVGARHMIIDSVARIHHNRPRLLLPRPIWRGDFQLINPGGTFTRDGTSIAASMRRSASADDAAVGGAGDRAL